MTQVVIFLLAQIYAHQLPEKSNREIILNKYGVTLSVLLMVFVVNMLNKYETTQLDLVNLHPLVVSHTFGKRTDIETMKLITRVKTLLNGAAGHV